ncbi:M20/M25/M40 family metallo-hydrolase [Streptomyces sp. NPDC002886]|uniref:M20/M25/M40 family metallo-hydrolase n=1 Tax=Streptomyces sp. NPDC002886 TaxID=3364667 RepID=UPI0036840939
MLRSARSARSLGLGALALALLCSGCGQAAAHSAAPDPFSVKAVAGKLEAFESIARAHGDTRASGTPGYAASLDYVRGELEKAGLHPQEATTTTPEGRFKGRTTTSLTADIPSTSEQVLLVGAHLDSVQAGPGINDNATGVTALLALAAHAQEQHWKPRSTVRLAFWGDEEQGLLGSTGWLAAHGREHLRGYVNIDMIGAKDGTFRISDSDGHGFAELPAAQRDALAKLDVPRPPAGSAALSHELEHALDRRALPREPDEVDYMSTDSAPFIATGIPTADITSVHSSVDDKGVLTYAPCYHQKCDTLDKVDVPRTAQAARSLSDAVTALADENT